MTYYGNELYHYGVLGMKWGIRRNRSSSSSSSSSSKSKSKSSILSKFKKTRKPKKSSTTESSSSDKKKITDMTDEELRSAINRMELERRYSDMIAVRSPSEKAARKKAIKFVSNVLEKSGEQLATQVVNELGAKAINKAFGYEAVYSNNKKK